MNHFFRRKNQQKGFSLVEMLISMVIFTIVMGIIYSYLLQTKKDIAESEVELNTADNAQTALNSLRKDLYQIGVGRDSEDAQPQIMRAGMYDLIFAADLDREVRNADNRYGCIDKDLSIPISPGSPFYPLAFLWDDDQYTGWDKDPAVRYGYRNIGAEIVRYSLDSNSDGIVNVQDLEDNIDIETERTHTMNEQDFWLMKEWWGCVQNGGVYSNQHSGHHPVAFNLRGMFYNPDGGFGENLISRFKYPSGDYPKPLFTYWGHFYNTITANDDPNDEDWPGEPIELWGDWGGQFPMLNQPATPNLLTGARDGVLSDSEIRFMYNNPNFAQVNLNYLSPYTGRPGEGLDADQNGNGIQGEDRLDQFIRRIGVTVVTESDMPNEDRPNLKRSYLANPDSPVYYYYQDYEVSIQINPRNLAYAGSPEIQMSQMTPTPPPPTPTPVPPTNTPDPSMPTPTPMSTSTPDPSMSPTPTPAGAFDDRDGEVILGTVNGVWAMSIDQNTGLAEDICNLAEFAPYSAGFGSEVIDIEPANFCDNVTNFDAWNDLVVATNANGGAPNLFYFKHLANTSINGYTNLRDTIVGTDFLDQITCIEAGNVGDFGYVDTEYDELVVAYHRPGGAGNSHTFVEVYFLNNPCGDLINVGASLPPLDLITENKIKDMVVSDFDGDGLGELVIMMDYKTSDGLPQVRYYPDINNNSDGWLNFYEWTIDWDQDIECAAVIAAHAQGYSPMPIEKDLIIVGENGDFRIAYNQRTGNQGMFPFNTSTTSLNRPTMPFKEFNNVTGAVVYDKHAYNGSYHPLLAISGNTSGAEYTHLVHYDIDDEIIDYPWSNCSGPIYPYTPPTPLPPTPVYPVVQTAGMAYVPVQYGTTSTYNRNLIIPANIDLFADYSIALLNPCTGTSPDDPYVNCQLELNMIATGITCVASTRNAESDEISNMSTPTPMGATPTP